MIDCTKFLCFVSQKQYLDWSIAVYKCWELRNSIMFLLQTSPLIAEVVLFPQKTLFREEGGGDIDLDMGSTTSFRLLFEPLDNST